MKNRYGDNHHHHGLFILRQTTNHHRTPPASPRMAGSSPSDVCPKRNKSFRGILFCHEIFKNRIFTSLAPLIADYTSWQEYSSYTPWCPSDLLRRVRLGGIMVDTPELLSAHQIHRNRTVHQEVQVGEILYKINERSQSHSTNCSRIFVIDRYSYQQYSTWKLSSPPPPPLVFPIIVLSVYCMVSW